MQNVNYEKTKTAIRHFLLTKAENDKSFFDAVKAMNFAEKIHTGFRKGGKTPTFQHQVSIALYLKTLTPYFINPAEVFVLAFLHDVYEDHPEKIVELKEKFPTYFEKVKTLSKYYFEFDEQKSLHKPISKNMISYKEYFEKISQCPSCSLVKGVDRLHNLATMVGVFKKEKQISYANEVHEYFLPMLKKAKKTFVEQDNAYENLKSILTLQAETILGIYQQDF